jgi:SH3 domain-containing YSC84-like protein 1
MRKHITNLCIATGLVFAISATSFGQTTPPAEPTAQQQQPEADMSDEIEQSEKAARIFNEIMNIPEQGIPQHLLDRAHCVAVFPSVVRAGFGIGGRGGRGVASCRTADGWSPPAYLNIGGATFGAQIGAEATDYVMLFMTDEGAKSLMKTNVTLGGNLSVSAGPVGREAGAATDIALQEQILTYSRSRGLFAGATIEGAVIETANNDMRDVYGPEATARAVLFEGQYQAPDEVMAFPKTLASFSPTANRR